MIEEPRTETQAYASHIVDRLSHELKEQFGSTLDPNVNWAAKSEELLTSLTENGYEIVTERDER